MLLTQTKYIKDLLIRSDMFSASPQKTPMTVGLKLSATGSESFSDPHKYRSIVGALQYVTITRPELSFAVNKVCQYMHDPKLPHWQAVKVFHVSAKDQVADIMTKPLSSTMFLDLRNKLRVSCSPTLSLRGDDRNSDVT
ncbi:Retrovirus-related Pol polyprotein from transposon TNT 1-94 [Senna tora]|uniref:Retrovirus-related Pol polyprotein from transposon TNT 1-94 n=1 Tax=Senna tora TaxID=362788 RepID=A0A834T8N4_9FABA|nr:Retrovirus-related Pol polyprotein from transposon TNT 1-94 [Senna tora]